VRGAFEPPERSRIYWVSCRAQPCIITGGLSVRPSVRPFVCRTLVPYRVHDRKSRRFSPSGSAGTLVFLNQLSYPRDARGTPVAKAEKETGLVTSSLVVANKSRSALSLNSLSGRIHTQYQLHEMLRISIMLDNVVAQDTAELAAGLQLVHRVIAQITHWCRLPVRLRGIFPATRLSYPKHGARV